MEDPGGDFTLCAKEEERRDDEAARRCGGWTIPFFILFVAALAALAHGDLAAAAALFLVFKLADLASLSLAESKRESLRSRLIRNVESKAILARTLVGAVVGTAFQGSGSRT